MYLNTIAFPDASSVAMLALKHYDRSGKHDLMNLNIDYLRLAEAERKLLQSKGQD